MISLAPLKVWSRSWASAVSFKSQVFIPIISSRARLPARWKISAIAQPYPMLHLLREDSITRAGDPNELLEIPQRNGQTLRRLGREKILEILNGCGKSV